MLLGFTLMKKIIKIQFLIFVIIGLSIFGCSDGDKSPTNPIYTSGEFSIFNEADVPIRLMEYSQTRGDLLSFP